MPNLASVQARAGGARWYHLDVPRHRTHFTVAGLHALLRRHGLEPVATHHLLAEHNPFGLWQSVVSRATRTPSWLYHALKRNAPLRSRDALVTAAAAAARAGRGRRRGWRSRSRAAAGRVARGRRRPASIKEPAERWGRKRSGGAIGAAWRLVLYMRALSDSLDRIVRRQHGRVQPVIS